MKNFRFVFVLVFVISGCTTRQMYFATGAVSAFVAGYTATSSNKSRQRVPEVSSRLMLYGGRNNKVFLGYISGSELHSDSILNKYGKYGSDFGLNSIWNRYGKFGGKYSNYSPWNSYATSPPVIVDSSGKFYGYFTVNKHNPKRTNIRWICDVLDRFP